MGKRHEKFRRMLYFLEEVEHQRRPFSLEELAEATGYKLSSIRTYYGKRLKNVLVSERFDGAFEAHGLGVFNEHSFIDYMTQRSSPPGSVEELADEDEEDEEEDSRDAQEQVIESLLTRAQDAMRGALELMQQPGRAHRLTLFGLLALEAWAMLLKAELARSRGVEQLYEQAAAGRAPQLVELLGRVYPHEGDPVRKNLEWVDRLARFEAELLVPELSPWLVRLYQATALNFRKRFEAVAGRRLFVQGAGLLLLLSDEEVPSFDALRQRYGDLMATRQEALLHELRFEELERSSRAFMIEVGFQGALTHPQLLDALPVVSGKSCVEALRQLELEQSTRVYPFDGAEVVHQINRLLPYERRLHPSVIDLIDVVFGVRLGAPNRYYRRVDASPFHHYSRAYVHWVVRSIREDAGWLKRAQDAQASSAPAASPVAWRAATSSASPSSPLGPSLGPSLGPLPGSPLGSSPGSSPGSPLGSPPGSSMGRGRGDWGG